MFKYKLKEIELGDTETQKGKKSTVSDINPETGAITWDIEDVADFSSTYKELEKAKDFLSKLEKTGKSKDDPAIDKLAAQIKELFNTFRTHIRKNYPEEYKRVLRLKESVNEVSLGHAEVRKLEKTLSPQNKKALAKAIKDGTIKTSEDLSNWAKSIDESVNETTKSKWDAIDVSRTAEKELSNKEWNERTAKKLAILKSLNDAGKFKKNWDEEKLQGWVDKNYSWEQVSLQSVNETALADKIIAPFDKEIEGLKLSKEKYQELLDKVSKLVKGLKEDEIKFNDEEMAKLHKDGQLKKGGHSFKYKLSQSNKDLKEEEVDRDEGEKLSIMKDENGKFIIGMAKGKFPRSKEAGPFDTQQKACEFFSKKGDFILNNLTEERLNEIDINKLKIIGDIYSSCEIPVNEGTFQGNEIAIYDGEDGETYIEKRGTGYYGYNNSFDFEAEDKAELKWKLDSWGYRLIAGSIDEGEGIGYMTPDAFGKKKKNVYTSQYGYKLVPKKIKGSGMITKQIFEKEELTEYSDFQQKRINGFDGLEDKVNSILPLISNAKNETAEYYNENPGSYTVVYSTDMVENYLDNIVELLKQSEE